MKFSHLVTDYDNKTGDTGRWITIFVVVVSVLLEVFDVVVHATKFDVQAFGIGMGSILGGLAVYLYGDNKSRPDKPEGA